MALTLRRRLHGQREYPVRLGVELVGDQVGEPTALVEQQVRGARHHLRAGHGLDARVVILVPRAVHGALTES
jgi:hypothetical protein